ncbi:MAG: transcription elongation protein SprT [Cyclobacteriaceae bacterium]|nr:transcription elongation protein SprT [Cyclobacteriaceae bacterium]
MNSTVILSILNKHVPPTAVPYCTTLWEEHPFELKLRTSRVTKVGDFICRPGQEARITINADSHQFLFLITYVHEVAHLRVHRQFHHKVSPHGDEWKTAFRNLCTPLLSMGVFPSELADALQHHLINPKASSFTDSRLNRVLRKLEPQMAGAFTLADIPEGSEFELRGRRFTKGKLKRTRILCREVGSRRNYLIAADALIGSS